MPIDVSKPGKVVGDKFHIIDIPDIPATNTSRMKLIAAIVNIADELGLLNNNVPVNKNRNAALQMIHRYAVLHAAIALILGPIAGFALTIATIKMICELGQRWGVEISKQGLTNFIAHYAGMAAGIGIAHFLNGLIPGIGNLSNAISSFFVTQALGRTTLSFFEQQDVSRIEELNNNIKQFTSKLKSEIKEAIENTETFKSMEDDDKKRYKELTEIIQNEKMNPNERNEALVERDKILERYKDKFDEEYNKTIKDEVDNNKEDAKTLIAKVFNLIRRIFGIPFARN